MAGDDHIPGGIRLRAAGPKETGERVLTERLATAVRDCSDAATSGSGSTASGSGTAMENGHRRPRTCVTASRRTYGGKDGSRKVRAPSTASNCGGEGLTMAGACGQRRGVTLDVQETSGRPREGPARVARGLNWPEEARRRPIWRRRRRSP